MQRSKKVFLCSRRPQTPGSLTFFFFWETGTDILLLRNGCFRQCPTTVFPAVQSFLPNFDLSFSRSTFLFAERGLFSSPTVGDRRTTVLSPLSKAVSSFFFFLPRRNFCFDFTRPWTPSGFFQPQGRRNALFFRRTLKNVFSALFYFSECTHFPFLGPRSVKRIVPGQGFSFDPPISACFLLGFHGFRLFPFFVRAPQISLILR